MTIPVVLNVSLNSANSETKIFVVPEKGLEPATSCVRHQDATHVRDGNFKKNPTQASMIYQIP